MSRVRQKNNEMRDEALLAALVAAEAVKFNRRHVMPGIFALSDISKAHRIGVDARLIRISDRAIQITKVDFGIGTDGGVRTDARQAELFAAGVSKCDGVTKRSPHQDGKALDATAYWAGKATWEHRFYPMIAVAFFLAANEMGHRIKWGGMFSTGATVDGVPYGWDCPHFELVD